MAFHFSENVGEAIKTAFGALADASEAHLAELASAVLSFLSGTALEPQLMAVCEATGMKRTPIHRLSFASELLIVLLSLQPWSLVNCRQLWLPFIEAA